MSHVKEHTECSNIKSLLTVAVVESITTYGTKKHKRGSVRANIVKANIPVQNGIVHLIDRPLVVMANTLYDHLCVKKIDVGASRAKWSL